VARRVIPRALLEVTSLLPEVVDETDNEIDKEHKSKSKSRANREALVLDPSVRVSQEASSSVERRIWCRTLLETL